MTWSTTTSSRVRAVSAGSAGFAGEGAHPARVDDRGRAADQRRHTLVVVVEGEPLAGGAHVVLQPALGDVDADEHGRGSLVRDPVSPDAGSSVPVTVRVARARGSVRARGGNSVRSRGAIGAAG